MDRDASDVPCGQFLQGMDLFGGDIPCTATQTTYDQDCLIICMSNPTATRLGGGRCFLENLTEVFPIIDSAGQSHRIAAEHDAAGTIIINWLGSCLIAACCSFIGWR